MQKTIRIDQKQMKIHVCHLVCARVLVWSDWLDVSIVRSRSKLFLSTRIHTYYRLKTIWRRLWWKYSIGRWFVWMASEIDGDKKREKEPEDTKHRAENEYFCGPKPYRHRTNQGLRINILQLICVFNFSKKAKDRKTEKHANAGNMPKAIGTYGIDGAAQASQMKLDIQSRLRWAQNVPLIGFLCKNCVFMVMVKMLAIHVYSEMLCDKHSFSTYWTTQSTKTKKNDEKQCLPRNEQRFQVQDVILDRNTIGFHRPERSEAKRGNCCHTWHPHCYEWNRNSIGMSKPFCWLSVKVLGSHQRTLCTEKVSWSNGEPVRERARACDRCHQ